MTLPHYTPRLELDPKILRVLPLAIQAVAGQIRESLDLIRREPDRLVQTRHSVLAQEYRRIAFNLYAAGHSLVEVREAFRGLALAGLRVAELRGTEKPFLEVVVELDPRHPPGDPRSAVRNPVHSPDARDFSLGNARSNFRYVAAALVSGEFDLARRIARLAGDPPGAEWAGPRSTICTSNDQHTAYAVKHLFSDERDEVLTELAGVRPAARELDEANHPELAKMIRALLDVDADFFLVGLDGLLRCHEQTARGRGGDCDFYLSLPGAGLASLALHRGLDVRSRLPADSPFLPLDLIDLAQSGR